MNLEYLGVEQNHTVLAGGQPEYELEFFRGDRDKLPVDDVTFTGVVVDAAGVSLPVEIWHTAVENVLFVRFPRLDVPGDYRYEVGYVTADGSRYRLVFGRMGVLSTGLALQQLEELQQGVRRMQVRLPEVAGGQILLEWRATAAALYAAQQVLAVLEESRGLLREALRVDGAAVELLREAQAVVVQRKVVPSVEALPEVGNGHEVFLVPDGDGWRVYMWVTGLDGVAAWMDVGVQAEAVLQLASTVSAGAVRLAESIAADDGGVPTAAQVRAYVQDEAGYVTSDALEVYAKSADVEARMAQLHADVLTSANAVRFVEISRAEFEVLPEKAENVYYLVYES